MRLIPALAWTLEGEPPEPLDARLVPLLEAIARSASLAGAVAACGISYRAAWGLLRDYERKLGGPLVRLERGRGARLTETGETLVQAQKRAAQRLAKVLPEFAVEVAEALRDRGHARALPHALRLRVAASHDLALTALAESLPKASGIELDVTVMGSLEALRAFAEGRADVAGFHVPLGHPEIDRSPFLRPLSARRDRIIRLVDREQGLILPPGNTGRVRNFRDIADRRLRFVNRQRGSGTRVLIDWMLETQGVEASTLIGYTTEEFTHAAVAATVASGGAEAGFGLRAAAAEYGLAFVPQMRERYFLAVRARDVDKTSIARLIGELRSPAFARVVQRLPGYRCDEAGQVNGLAALAATAGARSPALRRNAQPVRRRKQQH
jgi:molybdate transport repressor ModE-like protein